MFLNAHIMFIWNRWFKNFYKKKQIIKVKYSTEIEGKRSITKEICKLPLSGKYVKTSDMKKMENISPQ